MKGNVRSWNKLKVLEAGNMNSSQLRVGNFEKNDVCHFLRVTEKKELMFLSALL